MIMIKMHLVRLRLMTQTILLRESSQRRVDVKAKILNVRKEDEDVNDHLDVVVDPSSLGEEDDQVGASLLTLEGLKEDNSKKKVICVISNLRHCFRQHWIVLGWVTMAEVFRVWTWLR